MIEAKSVVGAGSLFTAVRSPSASRAERWLQEQLKRARREGVFTITVELTPELAELLLTNNPSNRPISSRLRDYVRDVRAGNWEHNGETIIVADTGELNDGQHRCMAVVETGRAITTEMTFGVARDTRRTIDIGVKRTVGMHLAMSGHPDANVLAHAASIILIFDKHNAIGRNPEWCATSVEIQEWCDAHPEIGDHLYWGRQVRNRLGRTSIGLFSALHFILSRKSRADADNFFASLAEGTDLKRGTPVYQLRELLIKEAGAKKKLPNRDIAALAIKAWNLYRSNRTRRALVWRTDGEFAESFPIPE